MKQPMNTIEEYLYGINMRLNIVIEQLSAISQHLANTQEVTVEDSELQIVTSESEKPKRGRKKVVQ